MRKLILACLCGLFFVSQCFADGGLICGSQTFVTQNISLANNSSENYGIVGVKTIFMTTWVRCEIVTTNRTILRYDIDGRVNEDMVMIITGRGRHRRRERQHNTYGYDAEGRVAEQMTEIYVYERRGGREYPVLQSMLERDDISYNLLNWSWSDSPSIYPRGIHASPLIPDGGYFATIAIPVEYGTRCTMLTKIAKVSDGVPGYEIAEFNDTFNITGRGAARELGN